MYSEQIREIVEKLKSAGRLISNVYSGDIICGVDRFWNNDVAILLEYNDLGVNRLYYYAHKLNDINGLLGRLPVGEYVLEYLTKNPKNDFDLLKNMGFVCLARMMRMSVRKCSFPFTDAGIRRNYNESIEVCPDVGLAKTINQVLWDVFDTRVSHLLNDDGLAIAIKNKEIMIHQDSNGKIDAVLQTVIQPQRFYINQVYNRADKSVIHSMLQKRLKEYMDAGGKYVYAWVDSNNVASIKFHQKYGLQHDGMWNMVYVLKKG